MRRSSRFLAGVSALPPEHRARAPRCPARSAARGGPRRPWSAVGTARYRSGRDGRGPLRRALRSFAKAQSFVRAAIGLLVHVGSEPSSPSEPGASHPRIKYDTGLVKGSFSPAMRVSKRVRRPIAQRCGIAAQTARCEGIGHGGRRRAGGPHRRVRRPTRTRASSPRCWRATSFWPAASRLCRNVDLLASATESGRVPGDREVGFGRDAARALSTPS